MKKIRFCLFLLVFLISSLMLTSCKSFKEMAKELETKISESKISANVRVKAFFSQSWVSEVRLTKTASGVIVKEDDNTFYVLCNNHTLYSEYSYCKIEVIDYLENKYTAELIDKSSSYDLALISFTSSLSLETVKISSSLPRKNDIVASLGEMNKERNVITSGKYKGLTNYTVPENVSYEENSIDFEVISHTSKIGEGSSGSMLLNYDLELIGINFSSDYSNDTFYQGYAIPQNKILNFLNEINFTI